MPNRSQEELVQELERSGAIRSNIVRQVMSAVDRKHYAPSWTYPYEDAPQPIGFGATISAPHMHAAALELLADRAVEGARVLDVGSGSGYLTACLGLMVGPRGAVVGVDHIPQLVAASAESIREDQPALGNVSLVVGDGRLGHPGGAPYDAIHVGAACLGLPSALVQQLAPGGRLVAPIEDDRGRQYLEVIDRHRDGTFSRTRMMGVRYVPLTQKEAQLSRGLSHNKAY